MSAFSTPQLSTNLRQLRDGINIKMCDGVQWIYRAKDKSFHCPYPYCKVALRNLCKFKVSIHDTFFLNFTLVMQHARNMSDSVGTLWLASLCTQLPSQNHNPIPPLSSKDTIIEKGKDTHNRKLSLSDTPMTKENFHEAEETLVEHPSPHNLNEFKDNLLITENCSDRADVPAWDLY